mgnify:CR=1 FL=1|jgi:hypothetical protein
MDASDHPLPTWWDITEMPAPLGETILLWNGMIHLGYSDDICLRLTFDNEPITGVTHWAPCPFPPQ